MTTPSPSNPYPIRYVRTPGAIEAYTINWILNPGDQLATSVWTVDPALLIVSQLMTGSTTSVTLAGGPIPTGQPWWNYHAVNKITTLSGFSDQRTVVLFTKQL